MNSYIKHTSLLVGLIVVLFLVVAVSPNRKGLDELLYGVNKQAAVITSETNYRFDLPNYAHVEENGVAVYRYNGEQEMAFSAEVVSSTIEDEVSTMGAMFKEAVIIPLTIDGVEGVKIGGKLSDAAVQKYFGSNAPVDPIGYVLLFPNDRGVLRITSIRHNELLDDVIAGLHLK